MSEGSEDTDSCKLHGGVQSLNLLILILNACWYVTK